MTCHIRHNILRLKVELVPAVIQFYTKICGMDYTCQPVSTDNYPYCKEGKLHIFSYKQKHPSYTPTGVCFVGDEDEFSAGDYQDPGYWKIGIVLQDVNRAVQCFKEHGIHVKTGGQFVDVGFLTSLRDPQGYGIELLQETFEDNFKPMRGEKVAPLKQPYHPAVGQITIRCTDAEKTCHFYTEVLGMKLVCTEVPGNKYPFTLYFFAYTTEHPPNKDVSAVENREWLYQRPFCQIEIQHRHNLPATFSYQTGDDEESLRLGHVGISLQVTRHRFEEISRSKGVRVTKDGNLAHLNDPDGYFIELSCEEF